MNPALLGGITILLAAIALFVWASLAPLSGAVVAYALVKSEQNRKVVQHPDGGVIKAIHVRDGDAVKAGQPIVELDSVTTDANYQLFKELAAFETLKQDRLDAEQQLAAEFDLNPQLEDRFGADLVRTAYQREYKIFKSRRHSLVQQLATLDEQLKAIDLERKALDTQIRADRNATRLVEEEIAMNRSLEAQQFVSKARVLSYERALSDYQSKLSEHEAELAQAEQRTNNVRLQMVTLKNDYQRLASEEFKESNSRLVELREKLRPAEDALLRKTILAPVTGKIVASRFHMPGQVAGPRDVLMEVVPDDEGLILEAQVSVDGIEDLYMGQIADIRFTAFKSRTTPVVKGHVTYVSADALANKDGTPFYQVHIRPDQMSLEAAGIAQLQSGMAAEVFILTKNRTALDYLLAPITDTLRKSMRER